MGCFFFGICWEIYWMLFLVSRLPAPLACLQCLSEDCKPSNILLLTFLSLPSAILIIVIVGHIWLVLPCHQLNLGSHTLKIVPQVVESHKLQWRAESKVMILHILIFFFHIVISFLYSLEYSQRQSWLTRKTDSKTNTNTAPQIPNTKVKSRENLHYREHSPSRSAGAAGRRPRSR